jgi:hypothetical protein
MNAVCIQGDHVYLSPNVGWRLGLFNCNQLPCSFGITQVAPKRFCIRCPFGSYIFAQYPAAPTGLGVRTVVPRTVIKVRRNYNVTMGLVCRSKVHQCISWNSALHTEENHLKRLWPSLYFIDIVPGSIVADSFQSYSESVCGASRKSGRSLPNIGRMFNRSNCKTDRKKSALLILSNSSASKEYIAMATNLAFITGAYSLVRDKTVCSNHDVAWGANHADGRATGENAKTNNEYETEDLSGIVNDAAKTPSAHITIPAHRPHE